MQNENSLRGKIKSGIERFGIWIDDRLNGDRINRIIEPEKSESKALIRRNNRSTIIMGRTRRDSFGAGNGRTITIRSNEPSRSEASFPPRQTARGVLPFSDQEYARTAESASMIRRKLPASENFPSPSVMGGARVSMENPSIMAGGIEAYTQFNRSRYWHQTTLSSRFNSDNFSKIDIDELAELLTELSPEVSCALWNFLLCCNSGFEINVTKPGTETPYPEAKKYLDECMKILGGYHGTINTFFDKTFMAIFMRGGYLYELVLDENGKDFVDIAAPDPKTLHFRRKSDPKRGQVWDFGQYQNGKFVSLDIPTIRYVPLHPLPGKIEGRPMINPVFFISIFLMSVLRDLKRVIQQQGYMRLDLTIDFNELEKAIPKDAEDNPEAFKAWADKIQADVMNYYGQLEPDDAFVHSNAVTVNNPVGTANTNSLTAMDSLFRVCERMAVRALKTIPALLGIDESGGDQASNNRKFEFYQKGNEAIQRLVESGFNDEAKMLLQAGGYQADVVLKFAQMRASEELRDLQVDTLKAKLAQFQRDQGWIDQDTASKMAVGKEAVAPAPIAAPAPGANEGDLNTGGLEQLQPDPGINRFFGALAGIRTPSMDDLKKAREIWKEFAPDEIDGLIEARAWPLDDPDI